MPCIIADVYVVDLHAGPLLCDKVYADVSRSLGGKVAECKADVIPNTIILVPEDGDIVPAVVVIFAVPFGNPFGIGLVPEGDCEVVFPYF